MAGWLARHAGLAGRAGAYRFIIGWNSTEQVITFDTRGTVEPEVTTDASTKPNAKKATI